jgi:hypothetical protein
LLRILKTFKHILGISQLFIFLTFVALGGIQGILQSEKNTGPDPLHISVQHKQNSNLEQGVFEIDVEKETEDGEFLKNVACFYSTAYLIRSATPMASEETKQLTQTILHTQPIFLELCNFRI